MSQLGRSPSAALRGRLSGEAGLDQDDAASMACGWLWCVFLVDRGAARAVPVFMYERAPHLAASLRSPREANFEKINH